MRSLYPVVQVCVRCPVSLRISIFRTVRREEKEEDRRENDAEEEGGGGGGGEEEEEEEEEERARTFPTHVSR